MKQTHWPQAATEGISELLEFALIAVIVIAGTAGELCVARSVRASGNNLSLRPMGVLRMVSAALKRPSMWLGIFFMTIGFFALLMAVSLYGVSYIVPSTALSYPVAGLGGKWLLGERVSRSRWMAIGLVSVGVLMVLLSGPSR